MPSRKPAKVKAGKANVKLTDRFWTVHTGFVPRLRRRATADAAIVSSHLYTVRLNKQTKVPDWLGYRATAADQFGRNSIDRNWVHRFGDWTLESKDYHGSGYSIGHLCPIASVRANANAWQCNWTGSVAPQLQGLNAGPWLRFEERSRRLAREFGSVFVLVGPLFEGVPLAMAECDEPHRVPTHFWATVRTAKSSECWIMPQTADRGDGEEQYRVDSADITQRSVVDVCGWLAQEFPEQ